MVRSYSKITRNNGIQKENEYNDQLVYFASWYKYEM
jgi:hypothetical protein